MRVHHLDCATMCPLGGRTIVGSGGRFVGLIVAHCLLIETDAGLTLVDTGIGTDDLADPRRLGRVYLTSFRPRLDPALTAVYQIRALGYRPEDVRDIVLTHLDGDHAGGLGDFPAARVHLAAAELAAAQAPATRTERERYRQAQWAHGPQWMPHEPGGEDWFGFTAVQAIAEPDVLLVPLIGHTRGHSGVAVRTGDRWLLHAGDAYFNHAEIDRPVRRCPPLLATLQRAVEVDRAARLHNQDRLRALHSAHSDEVTVFCAHDPVEFGRFQH